MRVKNVILVAIATLRVMNVFRNVSRSAGVPQSVFVILLRATWRRRAHSLFSGTLS